MNPQTLNGIPLIESLYLPEFQQVKVLQLKRWHTLSKTCYHKRINKKWRKRFGLQRERYIIQTAAGIVAHPNTIKYLLKAIEDAGTLRETISSPARASDLEKPMDVYQTRGYELSFPVSVRGRMEWFSPSA